MGERAGEDRMLSPDGSTSHGGRTLDVNCRWGHPHDLKRALWAHGLTSLCLLLWPPFVLLTEAVGTERQSVSEEILRLLSRFRARGPKCGEQGRSREAGAGKLPAPSSHDWKKGAGEQLRHGEEGE